MNQFQQEEQEPEGNRTSERYSLRPKPTKEYREHLHPPTIRYCCLTIGQIHAAC